MSLIITAFVLGYKSEMAPNWIIWVQVPQTMHIYLLCYKPALPGVLASSQSSAQPSIPISYLKVSMGVWEGLGVLFGFFLSCQQFSFARVILGQRILESGCPPPPKPMVCSQSPTRSFPGDWLALGLRVYGGILALCDLGMPQIAGLIQPTHGTGIFSSLVSIWDIRTIQLLWRGLSDIWGASCQAETWEQPLALLWCSVTIHFSSQGLFWTSC